MSNGSSMRRAVEKAQGVFEPRRPARGTTGKVKGPRQTLPMLLAPGGKGKPTVFAGAHGTDAPAPVERSLFGRVKDATRSILSRARGKKG